MSNNLPSPHEPRLPAEPETGGALYRPLPAEVGGGGNARAMVRRVYGALWRYKWLALAIVVVGTVAGVYAARVMVEPQYAVRGTIWVDGYRAAANEGPIQTSRMMTPAGWTELMQSLNVLEPVVLERRLFVEPISGAGRAAFASLEPDSALQRGGYRWEVDASGSEFALSSLDGTQLQRGRVGESVGAPAGFAWLPPPELLAPGTRVEFQLHRPHQSAMRLGSALQIRARDQGSFLGVGLAGDDPAELAATLNSVLERFVVVAGQLKAAQSRELTEILEGQLTVAWNNLQNAESELGNFRVSTVTLPSEREIQQAPGLIATQRTVFSNYFDLKLEREQLRRDRQAIQEALGREAGSLSVAALEVVPSVRQASELNRSLNELAAKRAELRALRHQFTDEYAPVRRLAEEVEALERQAIPRLAAGVTSEIAAREAEMDARLSGASSELRQIPERSIEEARLQRSVAIAADLYQTLRRRYETARLAAEAAVPDVQILDSARVPLTAVNDGERTRIMLMFLLGSLGLALAAPVLLDRVDSRLRYPEQVTNELGLPILGAVPHVASRNGKNRAIGREATASAVEALREIRLNVTHAFGAAGPLLATVTSPSMGDGKSFIVSNLALAFADLGHRTLIVDGDIRRGQLHRQMGGVRVPGLTDFLGGTATVEEIVQPTAYASLDMIPCGTRMQAGPELLGSAAMSGLVRELRAEYDVILIDSPPLAAGVDPFLLSTLTGNTILVLRNGRTDREFAGAKLELLDRLPIRMLGAILNDVPATGAYRYYSYVAGYEAEDEALEPAGAGADRQLESV